MMPNRTSATANSVPKIAIRTIPAMSMIRSARGVSVRTRREASAIPR